MAEQATEMVRVDREVADFLRTEKQYPRETYNDTLRRLLGLDNDGAQGRAEPRGSRAPTAP